MSPPMEPARERSVDEGKCGPAIQATNGAAPRATTQFRPRPLFLLEAQADRVHAVAQARRGVRGVVEDVSQVAAAVGAADLGALHPIGVVFMESDGGFARVVEAWPAAAGVELGLGTKELSAATAAVIDAFTLFVLVLA